MNILVDYLTISFQFISLSDLLKHKLKLKFYDMLLQDKSNLGKQHCLLLGGIKVHYSDNDTTNTIILEMSGKGCRLLESLYDKKLNWIDFIESFMCNEGSHIARLDIACDDLPSAGEKGILSIASITRHCKEQRYISKARRCIYINGSEENIIFGSGSSDRRLRIYNKALERGVDYHWIRAEFQLRNECALSFYMRALECGDIGKCYQGMLIDYLRFTREVNDNSHHQDRLTTTRWWNKFTSNSKRIKGFYIGGCEYNLQSLKQYITVQVAPSLVTLLSLDIDVNELLVGASLNKKQEFLIKTELLKQKIKETYEK